MTLYAFDDGEADLVVVGSKGGFPKDPAWADNLRADPIVDVDGPGGVRAVRAREVDGSERDRLWTMVCAGFANYASYERKAGRRIPLFVLEPVHPGPGIDPPT